MQHPQNQQSQQRQFSQAHRLPPKMQRPVEECRMIYERSNEHSSNLTVRAIGGKHDRKLSARREPPEALTFLSPFPQ
jgi:hypothetical protein